ncbi:MAG: DUF924 family protein [Sorangiineae bacterium]|nr:DUF924 family protein [Polyangiaceae bacterium]MEB2323001.1 DUF924 family protein [Sorangiineae bacterium]
MNQSVSSDGASGAREVLEFWRDAGPARWFTKDEAFDRDFRERFFDAHFEAASGRLESWLDTAESALAALVLLDQYPRNSFRGTAHMFATDGLALLYARRSLRFLRDIEEPLRNFLLLPFMHAESVAVQEEAVALYREHLPVSLRWAEIHRDVIARFGRFPHRNVVLGRTTTADEQRFLDEGGFAG